jgi:uncharacterized membrane protein
MTAIFGWLCQQSTWPSWGGDLMAALLRLVG